MARVVVCRRCGNFFTLSDAGCPNCQGLAWQDYPDPVKPYELNYEDKRLLQSLRIQWRENDDGA